MTQFRPLVLLSLFIGAAHAQSLPLERIKLPPGFEISLFADKLSGARSMTAGPGDILYVGSNRSGRVYAVKHNGTRATETITIASGLNSPNGVALKDGALYVAEINRILRYDDIANRLASPPKPVVVTDRYPRDEGHGWKFIRFGPDGELYVPVGAPCNVCERDPERYALLSRIKPDGSGYEVFARGIRNTVGFDWHPDTKELWFTDNGRD